MSSHKIIGVRNLSESTYVVRLERKGLEFQTGQFIMLGLKGSTVRREYSVYSGEKDKFLEVIIKEVKDGTVSKQIKNCKIGDSLNVEGPFGFYKFSPDIFPSQKFLFIATGTGISPFHSFVRTYPELDYKLIHGVRFANEAYDHNDFNSERIVLCTSSDISGDFNGRVTDYLKKQKIDKDSICFLCGNSNMIFEVFDILTGMEIPVSHIFSEVYF